ncbi:hypothetical protein ACFX2I_015179 [Malus domestica]
MGKKTKKPGKGKEKTEKKTAKAEEKRARRETKKLSPRMTSMPFCQVFKRKKLRRRKFMSRKMSQLPLRGPIAH